MQQSNLLNNLLNLNSPGASANKVNSRPNPAREPSNEQQDFQAVMSQTRADTAKPKPAAKTPQSHPAEPSQQKSRHKLDDSQHAHGTRPGHTAEKNHVKKQDAGASSERPVVADSQHRVASGQVDTETDAQLSVDEVIRDEIVELQPETSEVSVLAEVGSKPIIADSGAAELNFVTEEAATLLSEAEGLALATPEISLDKEVATESPLLAAVTPVSSLVNGVETEVSLAATPVVITTPVVDSSMPQDDGAAALMSSGDTKLSSPLSSIPVTASASFRSPVAVPEAAVTIVADEPVLVDDLVVQADEAETQDADTAPSTTVGNLHVLKQALQKPAESPLAMLEKASVADVTKPAAPVTSLVDAFGRPLEQPLAATRSFMAQIQLPQTLGQPQWSQAVGERVLWMAAQNLTAADIRLDPPDLGSMHVKVTVQQDQASVTFISPHQVVREALDQQATRLREMFAEQGLNLVHVDVSDRHAHERKAQDEEQPGSPKGKPGEEEELQVIGQTNSLNLRLVDHYA